MAGGDDPIRKRETARKLVQSAENYLTTYVPSDVEDLREAVRLLTRAIKLLLES